MPPQQPPPPWLSSRRKAWLAGAYRWIRNALGEPEIRTTTVRRQPWSLVLKVRAAGRTAFFKACAEQGRHEAALLPLLAAAFPDLVPAPLALDPEKAWLLLPDCGMRLKNLGGGVSRSQVWLSVLPRYAELQRWASERLDEWRRLGMPDRRPEKLTHKLRALLADDEAVLAGLPDGLSDQERSSMLSAVPGFEQACRRLEAGPVPPSLDHGDLHNSNLLAQDGHFRLVDWGDANLAHPFCSLLVTFDVLDALPNQSQGRQRAGALRDAYLDRWSAFADRPTLEDLFRTALWVGHICRALDFQHMLAPAEAGFRRKFLPYIARWLRGWYENRTPFV